MRFQLWNLLGFVTFWAGNAIHEFGLSMCGWAGWLDAKADSYR